MTSVRSHRLRLNGSKLLFFILVVFTVSCSRKVVPPVQHPDHPGELPKQEQRAPIILLPQVNRIALMLPFYSGEINRENVTPKNVERAEVATAFYQGFKLALDSLSKDGGEFELELFDCDDDERRVASLAGSSSVLSKDLIVGPIFPTGIKVFSEVAKLEGKALVSPLAASSPSQFKNPSLVTLNNGIDQHGNRVAEYLYKKFNPHTVNVVLINTRSADDEKFAAPLKKHLSFLSSGKFKIKEVVNTIAIEASLSKSKPNVVIVANDDERFVEPTLHRLYRLKTDHKYAIELIGHPNWSRLSLDYAQLQTLSTKISSSYRVDYNSEAVKNFVMRYRNLYWEEPSEYAFKGFDTGYYFGSLLREYGKEYIQNIGSTSYHGLHSDFLFSYDGQYGFRNINLVLLQYSGFDLKPVE